jgi:hypothetical protein
MNALKRIGDILYKYHLVIQLTEVDVLDIHVKFKQVTGNRFQFSVCQRGFLHLSGTIGVYGNHERTYANMGCYYGLYSHRFYPLLYSTIPITTC